jgi:hypothetical protein
MTRTLATFFVVAAMVALLAPVALAGSSPRPVRPDDRGGLLGVGAVEATKAGAPETSRRHLPDAADVPPVVVRIEPQPRDGFDWSAALLGAGAAAGLALVLAGSLVVMRTRAAGALQ